MMDYRKAVPDDIPVLLDLRIGFLVSGGAGVRVSQEEADALRSSTEAYLRHALPAGDYVQWLAHSRARLAGTGGIAFYRLPPNLAYPSGQGAYIVSMFTNPEFRGQGIATTLLTRLVAEAESRGCHKILLRATEMGRPVYERFGFRDEAGYMALKR